MKFLLLFLLSFNCLAATDITGVAGKSITGQQSARSIGATTLANMASTGIFTSTGDVWLYDFICEQITTSNQTAETVGFRGINATGTGTMTAQSGSIASFGTGMTISANLNSISNAASLSATNSGINVETYGHMFIPGGTTIYAVLGGTTGTLSTFSCYATFIANDPGATLTPLF